MGRIRRTFELAKSSWRVLQHDRELLVLRHFEQLSNKEIAQQLFITVPTVKSHATTIYSKLHVHRRREAVEKAIAEKRSPSRRDETR